MIDIHVHLSRACGDPAYSIPFDDAVRYLEAVVERSDRIHRFAVFPHIDRAGYDNLDANLSLLGLPTTFLPIFRFNLPRRLVYDARSTWSAGPKAVVRYVWGKRRATNLPSNLPQVLEAARTHKIRGLKFHDFQDGTLTETEFQALLREPIVLVLHTFPAKIRQFASRLTADEIRGIRAIVVLAHFGYSLASPAQETEDILWLARSTGDWLLFDGSFVFILPLIRPLLEPCLPKLLFGSDFPAVDPEAHLTNLASMARLIGVGDSSLLGVLEQNSLRVERVLKGS